MVVRHTEEQKKASLKLLEELLPLSIIIEWCQEAKHRWRDRCWSPARTIWGCCWKQLQVQASVRAVEDWAEDAHQQPVGKRRDGSDFCGARKRLPPAILRKAVQRVGQTAQAACGGFYRNLQVVWVDGSTLRLANTVENEKYFGRAKNNKRVSRSPVARLLVLLHAGSGAVLEYAFGPYLKSELACYWELMAHLTPAHLIVADSGFCSFLVLWEARRNGQQVLTRLPINRKGRCLQQWNTQDQLQEWKRPPLKSSAFSERLAACPPQQKVRVITWVIEEPGYRTWTLRLATTLLDPVSDPAEELVRESLRRWGIELQLRTLKTYYGLEQLKGKTPEICEKEVGSTLLAYNLVTVELCRSGAAPLDVSHERARRLVQRYSEKIAEAGSKRATQLIKKMRSLIADAKLVRKKRLPQPRAIVQRPSTFPVPMTSRAEWRAKYLAS